MSSDQPTPGKTRRKAAAGRTGKTRRPSAEAALPPAASAPATTKPGEPVPANSLTPEEQMALFEKELKENDWGHQPC